MLQSPMQAATMLGRKTSEMLAILKVVNEVNSCNINLGNPDLVDKKAALRAKFPKGCARLDKLEGYQLR